MKNSSHALERHERAFVLVAEKLGWLNWVDERIVRSAVGDLALKDNILASKGLRPIGRARHEETTKVHDSEDEVNEDSGDAWAGFLAEIMLEFSEDELSRTQPGPKFAEQPVDFVKWVRSELRWIERQKEVGIDPNLTVELGRKTRVWIAHGFVGRQSKASKKYLPVLIKLWDIAYSIEVSPRE